MSSVDEMQYQHLKKYMKDFEEKEDASCCDRVKMLEKQLDRYKRGLKPFISHKPMTLTRTASSNRKNGSLTDFGGKLRKRNLTKRRRHRRSYSHSRSRRGGKSRKGKK